MKKAVAAKKVAEASKGKALPKQVVTRRLVGPSKAARGRPDGADAFLRQRAVRASFTQDDLAEGLAEGFLGSATSGEDQSLENRDLIVDEELGGPFVTSPASREFAEGTDPSNPEDAEREPFPSVRGLEEAPFELESET
jgi:hypothetical protein